MRGCKHRAPLEQFAIGETDDVRAKLVGEKNVIGNVATDNNRSSSSFACHFLSLLVACATFFLIIAGALVTSHDAGLATSDWPLSNGQFFPRMVGNLFWEHGHRMVATTVGLLTIVLTIYLLRNEKRRSVRRLAVFALLAVVAQGLLGGLTV